MREETHGMLRKSGSEEEANGKDLLGLPHSGLGQSCPQHCPQPEEPRITLTSDPLGQPLSIREVAILIGCSAWTVRQRYIPRGLPHLRLGPNGKLIFYRNQVIRWLLERQQKGGTIR